MAYKESRRHFIKKSAVATAGLSLGISTLSVACRDKVLGGENTFKVIRNGRSLSFKLPVNLDVSQVEVRLFSKANEYIFEYDDVSPNAPKVQNEQTKDVWMAGFDEQADIRRNSGREQRFPTVDIAMNPDMEAIIEMNVKEQGIYDFNDTGENPVAAEIRIPYEKVEYWGNSLILDPKTNSIAHFYLSTKVEVADSKVSYQFDVLRDDWVGAVSIHQVDTGEFIASAEVTWDGTLPKVSTGSGVSRERMVAALSWATHYVLDCEDTKSDSATKGGEYLLYDLSAKTRLRPAWAWAWGPSAKMFLEAAALEGVDTEVTGLSQEALKQRAIEIGNITLDRLVTDPSSPAYGIVKTSATEASTVDALFLVGWGWMPLYRATGDQRYIDAGRKVAEKLNLLMDEHDDVWIPQAYEFHKKEWKTIMSFESSMGLPGLAALYFETGDDYFKKTTIRLADLLIRAFEKEDGMWGVFFYGDKKKSGPVNYWTKAFGYIADGLIEAHRVAPEQGYLKKVQVIADAIMETQAADGSFSVRFDRDPEFVGVGEKATTLWAGLYIRIYKLTGDKKYYDVGMKTLEWCMDNQYFGEDPAARGGIISRSWPSGINFRHWFDVVVTYSVSFFGNSLAEALSLDEWKKP